MFEQAFQFQIGGEPVSCKPYGNGHINETYLLADTIGKRYILQRINRHVFHDPEKLMQNIEAVCAHIKRGAASDREYLTLVAAKSGGHVHIDSDGEYWRMYHFIPDSICLQKAETPDDFRGGALAFGHFQRALADFDASVLHETIPRFHDTQNRIAALRDAISRDTVSRVKNVGREIEFVLKREEYAATLMDLSRGGHLPLRVTHNDTKLNNVLFDKKTRAPLCVVDLDTVMPGLIVNDFGDAIRFGASTAAEDEKDLSKVNFSMQLYRVYAQGYLEACGYALTARERECLRDGAKMMTLECGARFLCDYLCGDTYFRVNRDAHNLDRARTQFKLVMDMENCWDKMILID